MSENAGSLFRETFESEAGLSARWPGDAYVLEKTERGTAIKIQSPTPADKKTAAELPIDRLKGKKILLAATIKAADISAKSKPWNGIKAMIYWQSPSKKDYPQISLGVGSFDWQRGEVAVEIPADAEKATLTLGLEGVSGTVWFRDVSISEVVAKPPSRLIPASREDLSGSILIDAGKAKGPVNPLIFGHNLEAADGQFIFGSKPTDFRSANGVWDFTNARPVAEVVGYAKDIGMKMMRYPGGCLVHNFDWHKAVGPIDSRPAFAFGIDEYVSWCRTVGAEPLMTVAVYVGNAADKADLVEYCNAPATPAHPWAMKRAAWGHPEPYAIRYWEIGNEEDHGNHDVKPFQRFTAKQYAELFLEYEKAMKKVDPKIKMSVLMGTGTPPSDPWNAEVMKIVRDKADMVVIHTYLPATDFWMGSTDDAAGLIGEYQALIRKNAGRDIPLAVTEFNVNDHLNRFSYGAALFSADYIRYLLEPERNILMANYWHFSYGFWGFVRPTAQGWIKMPAYYTFRLWGSHFGARLLTTEVKAPHYRPQVENPIDTLQFSIPPKDGADFSLRSPGPGEVKVQLKNATKEIYPDFGTADASPASSYAIRFEARVVGDAGSSVLGLGAMDKRGWAATHSAIAVEGVQVSPDWTSFSGTYRTLPDATGITILARLRVKSDTGVNAAMEVRNLKITRIENQGYDLLTASSSVSADGKTLYLIVFNKSPINLIRTKVEVRGFAGKGAKIWTVNAPELESTSDKTEVAKETVSGEALKWEGNGLSLALPPHSMSAVEIK